MPWSQRLYNKRAKSSYGNGITQNGLLYKHGDLLKEKMKEHLRPFVEKTLLPLITELNRQQLLIG